MKRREEDQAQLDRELQLKRVKAAKEKSRWKVNYEFRKIQSETAAKK